MRTFQDLETILCLKLVISVLFSLPLSPLLRQLLFSQMGYEGSGKTFQGFFTPIFLWTHPLIPESVAPLVDPETCCYWVLY